MRAAHPAACAPGDDRPLRCARQRQEAPLRRPEQLLRRPLPRPRGPARLHQGAPPPASRAQRACRAPPPAARRWIAAPQARPCAGSARPLGVGSRAAPSRQAAGRRRPGPDRRAARCCRYAAGPAPADACWPLCPPHPRLARASTWTPCGRARCLSSPMVATMGAQGGEQAGGLQGRCGGRARRLGIQPRGGAGRGSRASLTFPLAPQPRCPLSAHPALCLPSVRPRVGHAAAAGPPTSTAPTSTGRPPPPVPAPSQLLALQPLLHQPPLRLRR